MKNFYTLLIISIAIVSSIIWVTGLEPIEEKEKIEPVVPAEGPGLAEPIEEVTTRGERERPSLLLGNAIDVIKEFSVNPEENTKQNLPSVVAVKAMKQEFSSLEEKREVFSSGVFLDDSGLILTGIQIALAGGEIRVTLFDQTEYEATVVGADFPTGLALVEIEGIRSKPVKFVESTSLKLGEQLLLLGMDRAYSPNVYLGVTSGSFDQLILDQDIVIQKIIKVDSNLNHSHSGWLVVNSKGEFQGVTTNMEMENEKLGGGLPVIPAALVRYISESIIQTGTVKRSFFGFDVQPMSKKLKATFELEESSQGVLVVDVLSKSPAEKSGLKPGDFIFSFDEEENLTPKRLQVIASGSSIGKEIPIRFIRKGKEEQTTLVVAENPYLTVLSNRNRNAIDIEGEENGNQEGQAEKSPVSQGSGKEETGSKKKGKEKGKKLASVLEFIKVESTYETGQQRLRIVEADTEKMISFPTLELGQIILDVNQIPVYKKKEYNKRVSETKEEEQVLLRVSKMGKKKFVLLKKK